MATARQHLQAAIEQMDQLVRDGEDFIGRICVERDRDIVVMAINVDPGMVKRGMPLLLGAYRADAVVWIADTYIYNGKRNALVEAGDITPREMFEAGDPRATEAIVVQHITPDGTVTMGRACYQRTDDGILVTEVDQFGPDDGAEMSGRVAVERDAVLDAAAKGRELAEVLSAQSQPVADAVVTKVMTKALGCSFLFSTTVEVGPDERAEMTAILGAQGLELDPEDRTPLDPASRAKWDAVFRSFLGEDADKPPAAQA